MGNYYLKFLCKIPVFGLFSKNKRDSRKHFMQGINDKTIILLEVKYMEFIEKCAHDAVCI